MAKLVIEIDGDKLITLGNGVNTAAEIALAFLHSVTKGKDGVDLRIDLSDSELTEHGCYIPEKNATLLVEGATEAESPVSVRMALVPGKFDSSNWGLMHHPEHLTHRQYEFDSEGNPSRVE